MYKRLPFRICLAFILAATGACDSGTKSKTRADLAADSALRADLALANRDTAVVDSIGRYPATSALKDSGILDTSKTKTTPAPIPPAVNTVKPAAAPPSAPTAPVAPISPSAKPKPAPVAHVSPRPKTTAPRVAAAPSAPKRSGNPCDSPVPANQKECLRTSLAAADQRLNGIYRALIVEMRLKPNASTSIAGLRRSQRTFLSSRDAECRRRGAGKEGALWAYPRVHCLAQFSDQRANELADQFSRLTAH